MEHASRLCAGRQLKHRPRCGLGANVYCRFEGLTVKGRVVALEARAGPEWPLHRKHSKTGAVFTYRIELTSGRVIYADDDDDACVHVVPRYAVGACVHCNVGKGEWAAGRVAAHSHVEPGSPYPYPYLVKLRTSTLIYIRRDDDEHIRDEVPTIAAGPGEHALCCSMGLAALAFEFDCDDQFEATDHELSPPNAQSCTLHLGWTESEAGEARKLACTRTLLDRQVTFHFCCFCDSTNRFAPYSQLLTSNLLYVNVCSVHFLP